jgi:hypothetical protein
MNEKSTPELPRGTPPVVKRAYVAVACVAAFLSVVAVGLSEVAPVKEGMYSSLRALHVLSPPPVNDQGCLATGWLPSGSTWESASRGYIQKAQAANPDYVVNFHQGREFTRSDLFKTNVQYRYEGCVTYAPRWQGLV